MPTSHHSPELLNRAVYGQHLAGEEHPDHLLDLPESRFHHIDIYYLPFLNSP